MANLNDFLCMIRDGEFDEGLTTIRDAARAREKYLAVSNLRTLKVGDTIRFNETAHPTYLVGLTAKVLVVRGKSITVECPADHRYGRFSGARNLRVPATLVESA